ncbi:hypothetical protein ACIG87_08955 [Micromonospora sp. NPDC051925]|uniref:hypothetical protein n=1 Tax=Micromonospora sp. NPDC051925 TaxID=3364288 RepID=UPI0037C7BE04
MTSRWEADASATFVRRLGRSAAEGGESGGTTTCPDIWELSNGDVAFIGRDLTEVYAGQLPGGVSVGLDERLVVMPRSMVIAAKPDLPDA